MSDPETGVEFEEVEFILCVAIEIWMARRSDRKRRLSTVRRLAFDSSGPDVPDELGQTNSGTLHPHKRSLLCDCHGGFLGDDVAGRINRDDGAGDCITRTSHRVGRRADEDNVSSGNPNGVKLTQERLATSTMRSTLAELLLLIEPARISA